MTESTAAVLWRHVRDNDLCPGATSLAAWRQMRWIHIRVGGHVVRVFPVIGYRNALLMHDVHHTLTGYATSFAGEVELAAWELASGGCGRDPFFWIDRLIAVPIGLVLLPRRTIAALRAGRSHRNLFGESADRILAMDFEEVRRMTRFDRAP